MADPRGADERASPPPGGDASSRPPSHVPEDMSSAPPPTRGPAPWPWLVGLVLLGLSLSPMLRPLGYDSFPFSSFPMFAHGRKDAVTTVHRAVAVLPDGTHVALPPRALGSDEVLQADVTLRHAIRRGKKASAALCKAVARRVAADPAHAEAVAVELLTERHDALAYFAGDLTPLAPPKRQARCKLPR
ncbi:hypothetical protein OV203_12210 [Nannocystis sp. ILAH1]|uniref:hypothetical protein n=2 Tax=unclassified Nannocystis TaxID=2627009 RepID=UPI0022702060|nr:hypothetical protein [Nannocystis sp. ILAH1]MCY0987893.1 hypothetical protein [Nannocystis sp. ILAH1]